MWISCSDSSGFRLEEIRVCNHADTNNQAHKLAVVCKSPLSLEETNLFPPKNQLGLFYSIHQLRISWIYTSGRNGNSKCHFPFFSKKCIAYSGRSILSKLCHRRKHILIQTHLILPLPTQRWIKATRRCSESQREGKEVEYLLAISSKAVLPVAFIHWCKFRKQIIWSFHWSTPPTLITTV